MEHVSNGQLSSTDPFFEIYFSRYLFEIIVVFVLLDFLFVLCFSFGKDLAVTFGQFSGWSKVLLTSSELSPLPPLSQIERD